MARATSVTLTGSGGVQNSNPVPVDFRTPQFNIGLALVTNGATTTFTAQYSLDDPYATYATDYNTNGTWFTVSGISAVTANTSVAFTIPCRAIRLQASAAGANTGTLTIVQASGL